MFKSNSSLNGQADKLNLASPESESARDTNLRLDNMYEKDSESNQRDLEQQSQVKKLDLSLEVSSHYSNDLRIIEDFDSNDSR